MDDPSTLVVWSWQKGVSVASTTAHSARVTDLCWSPYQENELATCGEHHLRIWQRLGNSFRWGFHSTAAIAAGFANPYLYR